jgi:hypothetical protein
MGPIVEWYSHYILRSRYIELASTNIPVMCGVIVALDPSSTSLYRMTIDNLPD